MNRSMIKNVDPLIIHVFNFSFQQKIRIMIDFCIKYVFFLCEADSIKILLVRHEK